MVSAQQLANKVAVVTGGSKGIGKAIGLIFAKEGANIVIADRDVIGAKKVINEIKEEGSKSLFVKTDVSKSEEVANMVKVTLEQFGQIDILVNNAGIISIAPVIDLEEKDWDDVMAVNAKGVFLCSRAVVKPMIKQRSGKIINISSNMGKMGAPRYAHYCASKFAVIGFTQSLALELASFKINVNAICPGSIETDMQKREWEWDAKIRRMPIEKLKEETVSPIPLGRMGMPDDVSRVALFLASKDSEYMTGQAINVSGGRVMF